MKAEILGGEEETKAQQREGEGHQLIFDTTEKVRMQQVLKKDVCTVVFDHRSTNQNDCAQSSKADMHKVVVIFVHFWMGCSNPY